jgi:hypothetical protein
MPANMPEGIRIFLIAYAALVILSVPFVVWFWLTTVRDELKRLRTEREQDASHERWLKSHRHRLRRLVLTAQEWNIPEPTDLVQAADTMELLHYADKLGRREKRRAYYCLVLLPLAFLSAFFHSPWNYVFLACLTLVMLTWMFFFVWRSARLEVLGKYLSRKLEALNKQA